MVKLFTTFSNGFKLKRWAPLVDRLS